MRIETALFKNRLLLHVTVLTGWNGTVTDDRVKSSP